MLFASSSLLFSAAVLHAITGSNPASNLMLIGSLVFACCSLPYSLLQPRCANPLMALGCCCGFFLSCTYVALGVNWPLPAAVLAAMALLQAIRHLFGYGQNEVDSYL